MCQFCALNSTTPFQSSCSALKRTNYQKKMLVISSSFIVCGHIYFLERCFISLTVLFAPFETKYEEIWRLVSLPLIFATLSIELGFHLK